MLLQNIFKTAPFSPAFQIREGQATGGRECRARQDDKREGERQEVVNAEHARTAGAKASDAVAVNCLPRH